MISSYLIHVGIFLCIFIIANLGQNIAIGFTGLLNLGHVAFVGIGAYASALLAMNGCPLWLSIPLAAIIAGIFSCLKSVPGF